MQGGTTAYNQMQSTFQPRATQGTVLCCLCGTNIQPNPSNMCVNCIRSQVDITAGVQKQVTILYCKDCGRYLQPPKHWVRAELESKELLTFCIKRIKGLSKVKLVDAGFIWTEPHSKRLKVKLTVQGEVFNGAILQQTFVVEYTVENNMCMDCNRHNANPNSWAACVQVRQKVPHKRTFFFLEQLIIKHGADEACIKIVDIHEGVDFFFASRAHGLKFIDFLQAVVPIKYRHDKQLVSHDTHTTVYNYKYTFSVEIAPVCKDDLICLPHKLAQSHGGIGPIVLCSRVTNNVTLLDGNSMRTINLDAPAYWRQPFGAILNSRQLVEYVVLDIDTVGGGKGRHQAAEAQVARASDFGRNDTTFFTRTHLGNVLHPGDHALGYDVANANLVGIDVEEWLSKGGQLPDVVLVRKSYEDRRRKRREIRAWRLRQLRMEAAVEGRRNDGQEEVDRERFLEDLEEDADLRSRINVYKDPAAAAAAAPRPAGVDEMGDGEDDEEELPQIPLEELLDGLEALQLQEEDQEEEEGGEVDMMEG